MQLLTRRALFSDELTFIVGRILGISRDRTVDFMRDREMTHHRKHAERALGCIAKGTIKLAI
jgi:hypothetical protein